MAANAWKIYYWGAAAGRAEFIRLILEEVGQTYVEENDSDKIKVKRSHGVYTTRIRHFAGFNFVDRIIGETYREIMEPAADEINYPK